MKSNKALLPVAGGRFIEVIYRQMSALFAEVLLITNTPESYGFLPCRMVPDQFPGRGPLAGIHAGLQQSTNSRIMVVACDMPYLHEGLIRYIATGPSHADVIIPESANGLEPLHALYRRSCLPEIEATLLAGQKRIVSFFPGVAVQRIPRAEVADYDPDFKGFQNINTPEDYFRLRQERSAVDCAMDLYAPELRRAQG
jgi:FdhD protein